MFFSPGGGEKGKKRMIEVEPGKEGGGILFHIFIQVGKKKRKEKSRQSVVVYGGQKGKKKWEKRRTLSP